MMRDKTLDKDFAIFLRTETKSFTTELLHFDKNPGPFSPSEGDHKTEVIKEESSGSESEDATGEEQSDSVAGGATPVEVGEIAEEEKMSKIDVGSMNEGTISEFRSDVTDDDEGGVGSGEDGIASEEGDFDIKQDGEGDIDSGENTPFQMDQVKSAFATERSGGGSEKVTENSLDAVSVLGFVGPKFSPTTKTVGNEIKKECAHKSRAHDSVGFQPMFRPHPVRLAPGVQLAKHAVHPLSPARSGVQLSCPSHDQPYANPLASPTTRASLLLNVIEGS
ncbi:hypothetical protein U1Q18_009943, partial [Sarracenia purpurea var. burkii]